MSYVNPKRRQGSQKEIPKVAYKNGVVHVSGYQRYVISPTGITLRLMGTYYDKFLFLKQFAEKCKASEKVHSLTDLGCSNGLLGFLAARAGIQSVVGLDHDKQCIDLVNKVCSLMKTSNYKAGFYRFGQPVSKTDVVTACALIHWVYSCTASFGSLEKIMDYLASLTNNFLLVEWVDPKDPAIRTFKHLNFGSGINKAPYTLQNFESALKKNFPIVKKVYQVTPTRCLYLGSKTNSPESHALVDAISKYRGSVHRLSHTVPLRSIHAQKHVRRHLVGRNVRKIPAKLTPRLPKRR